MKRGIGFGWLLFSGVVSVAFSADVWYFGGQSNMGKASIYFQEMKAVVEAG